jgi:hypothetical protein
MSSSLVNEEVCRKAARIRILVPASATTFSISNALKMIGLPPDLASTESYENDVVRVERELLRREPARNFQGTFNDRIEGAKRIIEIALPAKPGVAKVLKTVGFEKTNYLNDKNCPKDIYTRLQ